MKAANKPSFFPNFKDTEFVMTAKHNQLLRFASRLIRYFFLTITGFIIALVMLNALGAFQLVTFLFVQLAPGFIRLAVVILCVLIVAVVFESLRW
jgi:hypothetical protein